VLFLDELIEQKKQDIEMHLQFIGELKREIEVLKRTSKTYQNQLKRAQK